MEIEMYAMYWFQTCYKTVGRKSSVFSSLSVMFSFRTHTTAEWFYHAICQWLLLACSGYQKVFFLQRRLHCHLSNWPLELSGDIDFPPLATLGNTRVRSIVLERVSDTYSYHPEGNRRLRVQPCTWNRVQKGKIHLKATQSVGESSPVSRAARLEWTCKKKQKTKRSARLQSA